MIKVLEKGIISEPELIDFIRGYRKLVDAKIMSETSFGVVIENLGIKRTKKGGYKIDENSTYYLI